MAGDAGLYVDDPVLTPKDAARYLGVTTRTLLKLKLDRTPLAGEGLRWAYRRSTLNRYMKERERRYGALVSVSVL